MVGRNHTEEDREWCQKRTCQRDDDCCHCTICGGNVSPANSFTSEYPTALPTPPPAAQFLDVKVRDPPPPPKTTYVPDPVDDCNLCAVTYEYCLVVRDIQV